MEGDTEISLEEAYAGAALTVDLSSADGPRRVEVKIPAGIHEGARIRASGQGSPGRGGGPRGDLMIRIHVRPHPVFTRTGSDLAVRVATPLATAIAGGTVGVPTLRGTTAQLSIPAGTQNGARLRLRGLGMPHLHGGGAGDLLATVDIRLPHPLPDDLVAWATLGAGSARLSQETLSLRGLHDGERVLPCDPFDGADVALAGRGDHVQGEHARPRAAGTEFDVHRQSVEGPRPRPRTEQRRGIGRDVDVNRRSLLEIEVRPVEVHGRGEVDGVAGPGGQRLT